MPSPTEETFPRPVWGMNVAPGLIGKRLPCDVRKIPAMGIFEWQRNGDGTYTPHVLVNVAWLRVSEAEKLPLGISSEVMAKLIKAGLVQGAQGAPHSTTINVIDLLRHIEDTSTDPNFWTAERLDLYKNGM